MPWAEVLLGLLALYLLVKGVQAVRDFVIWYQEGRAFAAEQKRRQGPAPPATIRGHQHARDEGTADGFLQAANPPPETAQGRRDRVTHSAFAVSAFATQYRNLLERMNNWPSLTAGVALKSPLPAAK